MNGNWGNLDVEIDSALQLSIERFLAEQGSPINLAIHDGADDCPEFALFDKLPSIDFANAPTPDVLARDVLCSHHATPGSPPCSIRQPQIRIDPEEIKGPLEPAPGMADDTLRHRAFTQSHHAHMITRTTKSDSSVDECSLLDILARPCQQDYNDLCGSADATADMSAIQPSEIGNLVRGPMEDMNQQMSYQRHSQVDAPAPVRRAPVQPEGCAEPYFQNATIPPVDLFELRPTGHEAPLNLATANGEVGVTRCDKGHPKASTEVNPSPPKSSAGAEKVIKKMRKDSTPKNRYSKGASSSHYCHICGRKSRIEFGRCQNVNLGLCRKVICEKCLLLYEPQHLKRALSNSEDWTCTHCRNECPQVARCKQYAKNNQKRREKKARQRAERTVANPSGTVKRTRSASSFATNPTSDATSTANNPLMAGSIRHAPSVDPDCLHPRKLPQPSFDPSMVPIQPRLLNSLMGGPHIRIARVQNKAVGRGAQRPEPSSQALGCSQRPPVGSDRGRGRSR
eukprot:GFKZ01004371.1.p1 GENE.GFKZ01004371.1~~GFKZ01004371.1.p1  ORF type:complete len:511 (-),score=30.84 GFKZ01004371.1:181-1713(-)